jgi:hypothetical protein
MLALKGTRMSQLTDRHSPQSQLPSEILDEIARLIHHDSYYQIESLIPLSLVSKQFRKSTLPFLFATISHGIREGKSRQRYGLLRRLLDRAHLLACVHTLHVVRPPISSELDESHSIEDTENIAERHWLADCQIVRDSLPWMSRLRRIRYVSLSFLNRCIKSLSAVIMTVSPAAVTKTISDWIARPLQRFELFKCFPPTKRMKSSSTICVRLHTGQT